MFHIFKKSLTSNIRINPNKDLKKFLPKHPIKCAEFSSLIKKPRLLNKSKINLSEQKIKINYRIEDTRNINDLIFSLTSTGNIFIYEIYSKKLKKITCFANQESIAKGININSIRQTLAITTFKNINNIKNIKCLEISFEKIKSLEKFELEDFNEILPSEEFLDSQCFVQFDEYNKVILTQNILRVNKVFNFNKYTKNFEFTYLNLNEIRLTGGVVLITEKTNIFRKYNLRVFDINDGKQLYSNEIIFHPNKKIIFFEIILNYLLVKQEEHYPLYINLLTNDIKVIKERIDNEAFFMYSGKTNKFILVSLDRYLIFDIKGNLLKKIINFNLCDEVNISDIFAPVDNLPFVICWHNANAYDRQTISSLRDDMRSKLISKSESIELDLNDLEMKGSSLFEGISKISPNSKYCQNSMNNILSSIGQHSPLSSNNKNNIGFLAENREIEELDDVVIYAEHQIDIINMNDVKNKKSIPFRLEMEAKIGSIVYVNEMNSVFLITIFGELYEIKL